MVMTNTYPEIGHSLQLFSVLANVNIVNIFLLRRWFRVDPNGECRNLLFFEYRTSINES